MVTNNSNAPASALAVLASDKDWYLRLTVAANLNTSEEILASLSQDPYQKVRAAATSNPNYSKPQEQETAR